VNKSLVISSLEKKEEQGKGNPEHESVVGSLFLQIQMTKNAMFSNRMGVRYFPLFFVFNPLDSPRARERTPPLSFKKLLFIHMFLNNRE